MLDNPEIVCYNKGTKRERIPNQKWEDKKMERFEWMDTMLTELADWEAFEADLAEGDPWAE